MEFGSNENKIEYYLKSKEIIVAQFEVHGVPHEFEDEYDENTVDIINDKINLIMKNIKNAFETRQGE